MGFIKVLSDEGFQIIHKSGIIILSGNYEDAYLVDNKFLLIQKDNMYGLFTFFGELVYDFIFSDVYKEGTFIIFEDEYSRISVTTQEILKKKILNKNYNISFDHDDFEYFERN